MKESGNGWMLSLKSSERWVQRKDHLIKETNNYNIKNEDI